MMQPLLRGVRYFLLACVLVAPASAQEADPHVVGHWIFDRQHMDGSLVRDHAGRLDITLEGPVRLVENEVTEVLELDGSSNALLITYVNGELENTSTAQSGDVLYPPNVFYEIGAYRDDDEYYRLRGSLKEVRLYDRVVPADEIAERFTANEALAAMEVPEHKPQIIVGPYLQFATQHSITVLWETNREATTRVEYGRKTPLTEEVALDGRRRLHEVVLDGLSPQTNYFYRVVSVTEDDVELAGEIFTFQTAVQDETAFAFAVIGDTQNNPPVWGRIAEEIWRERPNFVALCGDIVGTGSNHDYERTWPIKEGAVNEEDGVIYIQTGRAGGSLENFAPTRSWFTARVRRDHHFTLVLIHEGTLQFQAIDLEGRLFDQFEIHKDAQRVGRD